MKQVSEQELEEGYVDASDEVADFIISQNLDSKVATLGKVYNVPLDGFLDLKNIIIYVLLNIYNKQDYLDAVSEIGVTPSNSEIMFGDIYKNIIEPLSPNKDVVNLKVVTEKPVEGGDTLNPVFSEYKSDGGGSFKSTPNRNFRNGTRLEMLDKLNILSEVPDDRAVEERLTKIREYTELAKQKKELELTTERPIEIAPNTPRPASSSHPPITYSVDPYREIPD